MALSLPRVWVGTVIILCLASNTVAHTTGIRRECTSDAQCDIGEYCYARFKRHTCIQCRDCERINRQYPQDGCAHELINCGPCKPGFKPDGDEWCVSMRPEEAAVKGVTLKDKDGPAAYSVSQIVGLTLGLAMLLLICCIGLCYCFCKKQNRRMIYQRFPKPLKQRIDKNSVVEEMEKALPSAPPESEYLPPPAYNNMSDWNAPVTVTKSVQLDRIRVSNEQQRANPFCLGNSYGQNAIDYIPAVEQQEELGEEVAVVLENDLMLENDPGPNELVADRESELPLEEVSLNLGNVSSRWDEGDEDIVDEQDEEPMEQEEDSLVPLQEIVPMEVGGEAQTGELNDSGISSSTSLCGLDQIVPERSNPLDLEKWATWSGPLATFQLQNNQGPGNPEPIQGDPVVEENVSVELVPHVLVNANDEQGEIPPIAQGQILAINEIQ